MTTLAYYEFQVTDLLHDPLYVKWSQPQVDNYINQARQQLVMDTACLRQLQQTFITAGQESYTFGQVTGASITAPGTGYVTPTVTFAGGGGSGVAASLGVVGGAVSSITFSNFGSGYSSAPIATINPVGGGTGGAISVGVLNTNTYDILDVHMIWGTMRWTLDWYAFSQFSAWWRPWQANQYMSQPRAWAAFGETQLFLGPPPDQSYAVEFDSVILPDTLLAATPADQIPTKYRDAVQFYAAHLAKVNSQAYGEAEAFRTLYNKKLAELGVTAYVRRIASQYPG